MHSFLCVWALQAFLFLLLLALAWRVDGSSPTPPGQTGPERAPLPPVALIVPLTGRSPDMENALHSLLRQDYSPLTVILATHGDADPARELVRELIEQYPHARHVEAPAAAHCCQKNQNLLASLALAPEESSIYVFCDANHLAKPDLVRALTAPIRDGRAAFTTGYRRTTLLHQSIHSVACHAVNRFMGLLWELPCLAQPWGGAMAAEAGMFMKLQVTELWRRTAADDSSLAGLLARNKLRAVYCPQALLATPLRAVSGKYLDDWLLRQILNPKFYTFGSWLLLGIGLFWGVSISVVAAALPFLACAGLVASLWAAAGGIFLAILLLVQEKLRRRIAPTCPRPLWFAGLLTAIRASVAAYCRSIGSRTLVWRGLRYTLDADGRVLRVDATSPPPRD